MNKKQVAGELLKVAKSLVAAPMKRLFVRSQNMLVVEVELRPFSSGVILGSQVQKEVDHAVS